MDRFRSLARLALLTNTIYVIWLFTSYRPTIPATLFIILELCVVSMILLFYYNHRQRKYVLLGGEYNLNTQVDIFITTKNEDVEIVRQTVSNAKQISYAAKTIYILDDGNRPQIASIAKEYDTIYLSRSDREDRRFKAANLNYGLANSTGEYILVLDADQKPEPTILDELLGHFRDNKVALVTTRQRFEVGEKDFNNDNLFYEYMQAGKNTDGCAISCGSGVIYRRSALQSIGGFQEWNIVEDLYTTYILNTQGWKSVYTTQSYTIGDAPQSLSAIYKQRGLWAQDTLRLFFWRNPLFQKGLNLNQRLHYFEMGYTYIFSAIIFPCIYLISFYSLLVNDPVLEPAIGISYLVVRIPSFYSGVRFFNSLDQWSNSSRIWAGLFPVYFWSLIKAVLYKKPEYKVTQKGTQQGRNVLKVAWQLIFLASGIIFLIFHLSNYGITDVFVISLFWVAAMFYWLIPITAKGLNLSIKI